MQYTILTQNGVNFTNIDEARNYYFNSGMRDGIEKGVFNEGTFIVTSANNEILFDTCELIIGGHHIKLTEPWTEIYNSRPSAAERRAVIAEIVVDDNEHVSFRIFTQLATVRLTKDELYKNANGAGTYQIEIGRFTLTPLGTVTDVVRTLKTITGGSSGKGEHFVSGNMTTVMLESGMQANVIAEDQYNANGEYEQTNMTWELPETAGTVVKVHNVEQANLDFSSDPQSQIDNKMDKSNPTGTGAFSLNRQPDTTVGAYSFAEGYNTQAIGDYSHAEGQTPIAIGNSAHAEGRSTVAGGNSAHAEGYTTAASGDNSHSEGTRTRAFGDNSHAEGLGTWAAGTNQHVFGTYNVVDNDDDNAVYTEIVGNGTGENARSNARTLDWKGNEWLAGNLTFKTGKTAKVPTPTADEDATPKSYVVNLTNYQRHFNAFGILYTFGTSSVTGNVEYVRLSPKSGILSISCRIPQNTEAQLFSHFQLSTISSLLGLSFKHPTYYISGNWVSSGNTDMDLGASVEVRTNGDMCMGRYYTTNGDFGGWSMAEFSGQNFTINNLYVEEN